MLPTNLTRSLGTSPHISVLIWQVTCYDVPRQSFANEARLGLTVNMSIHTSTFRYAVIAVRNEPPGERLVISYPNEKVLRDLIAAPSILRLGYRSREEAIANIDRGVSTTTVSRRESKVGIVDIGATLLKEVGAASRRLVGNFGSASTWRILRNLCQHSSAHAIRFVYSRNILSSTVRAFMSY